MGRRAASFGAVDTEEAPPRPWSGKSICVSKVPEETGVSRSLLYLWMKSGVLPYTRPGRERIVCRETIRYLLRKHEGM